MANWVLFFQPHVSEWPNVKRRQSLAEYIEANKEIKRGDIVFHFAGSYGFIGWGYVKKVRIDIQNEGRRNMFIEIMFSEVREQVLTNGDFKQFPLLVELRERIEGNLVALGASEFNDVNRILRSKNVESPDDLPEFEVRIGKFGVKDDTSLRHELRVSAETYGLVSLLFIDLDNFKSVNDKHNHQVGDQIIRETLSEIAAIADTTGELFHRSGDEMIVMLPDISNCEAMIIAESIRNSIEQKEFTTIGQGVVTSTIGVATYPDDCQTVDRLESSADEIMKRAKQLGKNIVFNHSDSEKRERKGR